MKHLITFIIASVMLTSCSTLKPAASSNSMATTSFATTSNSSSESSNYSSETPSTEEKTEASETSTRVSESTSTAKVAPAFPTKADINLDDEVIDDNAIQDFSGRLILSDNGELYFQSNSCAYKNQNLLLDGLNGKKFKHKKWKKRVKKSDHKVIENVLIKGVKSRNNPLVMVKKISKPLSGAKTWSSGQSALYLEAAVELYKRTIELREQYKVFSVNVEEVDDPELGRITEYSIYDANCNKLTPEEIKKISDKDLDGLNSAVKIGGGLLLKQAALTGLAALSTNEIASCSIFEKIQCGKDGATAAIYQAAIVAQLPKIVKNLKESKKHIERLRAE